MTMNSAVLVLLLSLTWTSQAFLVAPVTGRPTSNLAGAAAADNDNRLDVVLFGVGDLRVSDHGGLQTALQHSTDIMPLVVLDPSNLRNIPGLASSSGDTATLLNAALSDLETNLRVQFNLELTVEVTTMDKALKGLDTSKDIHIHVCDLDPVDNAMSYGPYALLETDDKFQIHPWTNHLRAEPWDDMGTLADMYPVYESNYVKGGAVLEPLTKLPAGTTSTTSATNVPSADAITELLHDAFPGMSSGDTNTGLYGTHWGGLAAKTIAESAVAKNLNDFCFECNQDDAVWEVRAPQPTRNSLNLEHASMKWIKAGGTDNMLPSETMTRYLAAPLLFGTVSPRQVWHSASSSKAGFFTPALQTLMEQREWHKLLAASEMSKQSDGKSLEYGYWRWHGLLCRYAKQALSTESNQSLVLVHGFGASSSQWQRSVDVLNDDASQEFNQVLAPDLIGFGHCEKPAITYTQYLWCGFVGDFVKQVGVMENGIESFCVGGNSIGGFTSMGVASDDSVLQRNIVSSFGALGTGRCTGLILFNSAGNIQSKEEVETLMEAAQGEEVATVAQLTAKDGLDPCKSFPRPLARLFGEGLLAYLRPSIQSICKNVYPVTSENVDDNLTRNIERDSLDPGAINVMISGTKLPTPRTANEMLLSDFGSAREFDGPVIGEGVFEGPVLVAQGMLDPLNDAKTRAKLFGELRSDITVSPINGGHCPHDEMPKESMEAVLSWSKATQSVRMANLKTALAVLSR